MTTLEGTAFDTLLQRQRELEDHMLAEGARRFRERVQKAREKGRSTEAGASRKLLVDSIEPFEKQLRDFIDYSQNQGKGRKHFAYHWLMKFVTLDAKGKATPKAIEEMCSIVAFMSTKVILNPSRDGMPLKVVALGISEILTDELKYRRYQQEAPGLYKYQQAHFQTTSYSHMSRVLDAGLRYAEVDTSDLSMEPRVALVVGCKLVDLFIQSTGLVELTQGFREKTLGRRRSALRRETNLKLTPQALEWIDARNDAIEFHWPVNLPMVVPPLAWSPDARGGYRFGLRGRYKLVKRINEAREREIAASIQPAVYEAVNRIQSTAWRVNPSVLALIECIVERGGELCGVPKIEPHGEPRRPPEIEEFNAVLRRAKEVKRSGGQPVDISDEVQAYADEWSDWRKRAHAVKNAEHRRMVDAKIFLKTYSAARGVRDEGAIWFPYNVDFRGRVYPIVNYLTPQGDDLSRGLLTFADAKPLGEDGADWLALHGANVADEIDGVKLSKLTLQERVDWIVANTVRIEAAVVDPFGERWWMQAENPLQFFAFMVEWAGYVAMAREGRGEEYVCSLPCSMDGTCNGLQHYSALLLDETAARAVNVIPQERPQDIYQSIADCVIAKLEILAADEPFARLWLTAGIVGRKLCKRPTMTFPYGSRKFGFKDQIVEFLKTHEEWPRIRAHFDPQGDDKKALTTAAVFMAGVVWDAISENLDGAVKGMDWLQSVARLVCQQGKRVEWRVPGTGFLVRQDYMKATKRCINTCINGKFVYPTIYTPTANPNAYKQANAVAPNFVHSLDASCLMLTVAAAATEGIESFMMIHDSYGTHASDCALLARVTRESFFKLYSRTDILADFAAQMKQAYGIDAPALPVKGALELSQVMVSDYFFC